MTLFWLNHRLLEVERPSGMTPKIRGIRKMRNKLYHGVYGNNPHSKNPHSKNPHSKNPHYWKVGKNPHIKFFFYFQKIYLETLLSSQNILHHTGTITIV